VITPNAARSSLFIDARIFARVRSGKNTVGSGDPPRNKRRRPKAAVLFCRLSNRGNVHFSGAHPLQAPGDGTSQLGSKPPLTAFPVRPQHEDPRRRTLTGLTRGTHAVAASLDASFWTAISRCAFASYATAGDLVIVNVSGGSQRAEARGEKTKPMLLPARDTRSGLEIAEPPHRASNVRDPTGGQKRECRLP
jgi:hypothetical protein